MQEFAILCSRPGRNGGGMPLTHSVSGYTRRKWTWSMGGGHGGKLDSLGRNPKCYSECDERAIVGRQLDLATIMQSWPAMLVVYIVA
jgi:hypothetical protein